MPFYIKHKVTGEYIARGTTTSVIKWSHVKRVRMYNSKSAVFNSLYGYIQDYQWRRLSDEEKALWREKALKHQNEVYGSLYGLKRVPSTYISATTVENYWWRETHLGKSKLEDVLPDEWELHELKIEEQVL